MKTAKELLNEALTALWQLEDLQGYNDKNTSAAINSLQKVKL